MCTGARSGDDSGHSIPDGRRSVRKIRDSFIIRAPYTSLLAPIRQASRQSLGGSSTGRLWRPMGRVVGCLPPESRSSLR
jgi:hypothetical protein